MFGIVRPCRHGLCSGLFEDWLAHLCGLCLTLRREHGQAARLVTNYDGLLISVLAEAQEPGLSPRRKAGPCALRGMRGAEVVDARAAGARLAASVSLLLAAGKMRDHVADGDGAYARKLVAAGAGKIADRWDTAGVRTGAAVGFDPGVLQEAVARQARLESVPGLGLLEVTRPTEDAVAAAFAHTAVLSGKPHNVEGLAEAGRFFGRIVHLVDAMEDLGEDLATGAYNPLVATDTDLAETRRLCEHAAQGIRLALDDLDLVHRRLVEALLVHEVSRTVERVFAEIPGPRGQDPYGPQGYGPQGYGPPPQPPYGPPPQPPYGPGGPGGFGGGPGHHGRPSRPGFPIPCFTGSLVCATCGVYQPEWSKHYDKSLVGRCWCTRPNRRRRDRSRSDCCGDCCECACTN